MTPRPDASRNVHLDRSRTTRLWSPSITALTTASSSGAVRMSTSPITATMLSTPSKLTPIPKSARGLGLIVTLGSPGSGSVVRELRVPARARALGTRGHRHPVQVPLGSARSGQTRSTAKDATRSRYLQCAGAGGPTLEALSVEGEPRVHLKRDMGECEWLRPPDRPSTRLRRYARSQSHGEGDKRRCGRRHRGQRVTDLGGNPGVPAPASPLAPGKARSAIAYAANARVGDRRAGGEQPGDLPGGGGCVLIGVASNRRHAPGGGRPAGADPNVVKPAHGDVEGRYATR